MFKRFKNYLKGERMIEVHESETEDRHAEHFFRSLTRLEEIELGLPKVETSDNLETQNDTGNLGREDEST